MSDRWIEGAAEDRSAPRGKGTQEERRVGRTLGQPAHQVAVPFAAVRYVHPDGVAELHQPELLVRPDSVQHLELVAARFAAVEPGPLADDPYGLAPGYIPSLHDPRGEVALAFRDYPANVIPSTIVLDAQGRVAAVYTGAVAQEDLRGVLDLLMAEEG
jgi:hypothetical protein